jgi:hypothetical protein
MLSESVCTPRPPPSLHAFERMRREHAKLNAQVANYVNTDFFHGKRLLMEKILQALRLQLLAEEAVVYPHIRMMSQKKLPFVALARQREYVLARIDGLLEGTVGELQNHRDMEQLGQLVYGYFLFLQDRIMAQVAGESIDFFRLGDCLCAHQHLLQKNRLLLPAPAG